MKADIHIIGKGGERFDYRFGRIAKRKPLIAPALRLPNVSNSGIKGNAENKNISVNFLDEGKETGYTEATEQRR